MPASGFSAAGVFLNELFDRIGHVRATVEWLLHVVAHVVLSPHENVVNAGVPQPGVPQPGVPQQRTTNTPFSLKPEPGTDINSGPRESQSEQSS